MDANKLFERASQAAERGNYDYAIELYQQLLTIQPDFVKARRELRFVERKRVQENGGMNTGVMVVAGIKGIVPFARLVFLGLTKGHPEKRMSACEKFLENNPDCGVVLSALAGSAVAANYLDTAVLVYEDIKEKHPSNLNALRSLARLYQRTGQIDKASDCYQRLLQSKPIDEESHKAIKDLAALKTMKEGRWDEAGESGGYRKMLKDKEKAVALEQQQHVVRSEDDISERIERVKADVAKDPRNVKILTQLADLYQRGKQRALATETFAKIKEIDPKNLVADRRLVELELEERSETIDTLKNQLKEKPNDAAVKAKLDAATKELTRFRIDQLQSLVAGAPTDLGLKYKLGFALYENGDVDGSVPQFQQSSRDPKNRRDSHRMLGYCFQHKGMFDMAADQFQHALEHTGGMTADAKDIIYQIGVCFEKQGKLDKAEEAFKKIYQVDISFKDVQQKIDAIYKRKKGQ